MALANDLFGSTGISRSSRPASIAALLGSPGDASVLEGINEPRPSGLSLSSLPGQQPAMIRPVGGSPTGRTPLTGDQSSRVWAFMQRLRGQATNPSGGGGQTDPLAGPATGLGAAALASQLVPGGGGTLGASLSGIAGILNLIRGLRSGSPLTSASGGVQAAGGAINLASQSGLISSGVGSIAGKVAPFLGLALAAAGRNSAGIVSSIPSIAGALINPAAAVFAPVVAGAQFAGSERDAAKVRWDMNEAKKQLSAFQADPTVRNTATDLQRFLTSGDDTSMMAIAHDLQAATDTAGKGGEFGMSAPLAKSYIAPLLTAISKSPRYGDILAAAYKLQLQGTGG